MSVRTNTLQLQQGESTKQWIKRIASQKYLLVLTCIATIASLFHLYTGLFGTLFALSQRSIHFAMIGTLALLLYPISKKFSKTAFRWIVDLILVGLALSVVLYMNYYQADIIDRVGQPNMMDIIMGIVVVCLILEITRRTMGWPLVIITLLFIAYLFVGPYMPSLLAHRGFSIKRVASIMFMGGEGVWGMPMGVSATFVYLFVLFGCFLKESRLGDIFAKMALSVGGRFWGGPALTTVVSCLLMGTISGSSTANAVTTGSFTIPLMKRTGYKPEIAAAVTSTASTGGTIMPPIMGAAAFIMVALTGIPYVKIIAAAAIPASLFFLGIMGSVYFYARRAGLKPMDKKDIPSLIETIKEGFHLFIPIAVLVYMLVKGYSPTYSASISIVLIIICSSLRSHTRMKFPDIIKALSDAAYTMIVVMAACASAGVIIGAFNLTGLGLRFSSVICHLSGGHLIGALIIMMIANLILGMGLPVGASYVILAIIGAPALIQLGLPLMTAHFFLLFFSPFSALTPPVMITTYTAAAIAEANPWHTLRYSLPLAAGACLVPYIFVYHPSLLGTGSVGSIVFSTLVAATAIITLSSALQGFMLDKISIVERVLLGISALVLLSNNWILSLAGLVLIVIIIAKQVIVKWNIRSKQQQESSQV